jgi:2-dehydropantoate 2-reductase
MKMTIAGSGAMGCRFGAALFEAGHDVVLLDGWREHVTAINQAGLRVTDETGTRTIAVPARLFPDATGVAGVGGVGGVEDVAGVGSVTGAARVGGAQRTAEVVAAADLVIVFAKATATATVAAAANSAGAIGPATLVLTLQNGLGNIEALLPYVPADRLLAGTTTLGTELLGPGHIRALGTGETVLGSVPAPTPPVGAVSGEPSPRAAASGGPAATDGLGATDGSGASGDIVTAAQVVAATLAEAGISVRTVPNALEAVWAKVAFNCVMNSLCSIASIPVSALARYDGFDQLAGSILDEVAAVARAEGVIVDTAAALRVMRAQFDPSASGYHLASMLQDLMNGRPTEIAHLNGAIAARAGARDIAAPVNATVSQLIGLLEATWPGRVNRLHQQAR